MTPMYIYFNFEEIHSECLKVEEKMHYADKKRGL